jgi:hypothetical protein
MLSKPIEMECDKINFKAFIVTVRLGRAILVS